MIRIVSLRLDGRRTDGYRSGCLADRTNPVLSWAAVSDQTEDRQSAYRVTAGSWDSGWITGEGQQAQLPPGTLLPETPTAVTLCLRNRAGETSQPYTVMLLNAAVADWDAPWIGLDDAQPERVIYLRRQLNLTQPVRQARLDLCGLGYHAAWINGTRLDDARLDPAFMDYSKHIPFVPYLEAAPLFHPGENEVIVAVGSGWRRNGRLHENQWFHGVSFPFEGPQQATARLRLTLADGTTWRLTTDENWEAGYGPMGYANLFTGAVYDAREPLGPWRPARRMTPPGGQMQPMLLPPVLAREEYAPLAWWQEGADAVVLDFGQNLAGVVRLPLPPDLAPGQVITLSHTEELTEDGRLFPDTLRIAKAQDTYIAAGDARDLPLWEPEMTYHGFRYVRVSGLNPAAMDWSQVRAVALRTAVDKASFFRCGNALVTRLHEMCVATERSNLHSILTDCPQRDERMGWLNDATVRFESTPYQFEVGALFPKVIQDIMDAQHADGAIGDTAPFMAGCYPADPVCSSFLLAGRETYLHAGDLTAVRKAYPAFAAWERCLLKHSEGQLPDYSYWGDWAGPADSCVPPKDDSDAAAASAVTPGKFLSAGFSYLNCRLLAEMARWLEMPQEAAQWEGQGEAVRQALLAKWYCPQTGSFATGSQGCLALALRFGLAPDPALTALRLHEAVERAGYRLTTGNLCSRYIFDALTAHGYVEDAWRLITRDAYPSLGWMLQQEATTVWERFELMKNPAMNSHNHPMYGAVDGWFYAYLAGLTPTAGGWRRFRVKPYLPAALDSVQAGVETPMGRVDVRWTRRYGKRTLQVNVPFGAEAEVDFCGQTAHWGSGFHSMSLPEAAAGKDL